MSKANENVRSADKKPEMYTKPDGKRGVRMVAVDREIVKKDAKTEGAMKRMATSQSSKPDRMAGKGLDTYKKKPAEIIRSKKPTYKLVRDTLPRYDKARSQEEAYKVGQTVKPTKGPHAGQDHEVIHVHGDGSYNIKPKNMPASRIRYRLGAARAKHNELKEALKVSDGMGAWIDDFSKSDAPQFKGKNKKEKRDMAIAAYLSAKKNESKEIEEKKITLSRKQMDRALAKAKAKPASQVSLAKAPFKIPSKDSKLDEDTHTVDIDHMGGHDSNAKKHNITIKKSSGSDYAHSATGKKKDLQKYLVKHYDDHETAKEIHPEVFKGHKS